MIDDIKDIKPLVNPPLDFTWVWWGLMIIVLFGVIVFFLLRQKSAASSIPKRIVLPWEAAFEQLRKLKDKHLVEAGFVKDYYYELSTILRHYIEARFNIRAPEMTTDEFLVKVNSERAITPEHQVILKEFMIESDMIKYAKHQVGKEDADRAMSIVQRFIEETKVIATSNGT